MYICDGEKCGCVCVFKRGVQKFSEESILRHRKAGRKRETPCVKCAKPKNAQRIIDSPYNFGDLLPPFPCPV